MYKRGKQSKMQRAMEKILFELWPSIVENLDERSFVAFSRVSRFTLSICRHPMIQRRWLEAEKETSLDANRLIKIASRMGHEDFVKQLISELPIARKKNLFIQLIKEKSIKHLELLWDQVDELKESHIEIHGTSLNELSDISKSVSAASGFLLYALRLSIVLEARQVTNFVVNKACA